MPSQATGSPVDDLNLLRDWREPVHPRRLLRDAVASIIVHIFLLVLIFKLPEDHTRYRRPEPLPEIRRAVHLVAPRFTEPTQKAPNKGKITRELDVRSMQPAPQRQAPRFRAPQPAPGPVASAAPAAAPVIEQPQIQVAAAPPPPPPVVSIQPPQQPPPPPQQQTPAAPPKPKLAFESVSAQPIHVEAPNPIKIPMPGRTPGAGGTIVGDSGDEATTLPNQSNIPSPGRIGSNLQLLSDPKGVDFKPYLIQVLTAVRRNWLAIIPESARMGRRGRVLIQFAIDKTGGVPKLVIAEGAGTDALDRAAVAAISASYPFPPLPPNYQGDQIRVQLAFSYNLPNR
jgi:TonB family protein